MFRIGELKEKSIGRIGYESTLFLFVLEKKTFLTIRLVLIIAAEVHSVI